MLLEKNERYKAIFLKILEMSDDGFIVVDPNGIITDINEQYCKFLKSTRQEMIGKNICSIIPNTKMIDIMKNKFNEEGKVHVFENGSSKEKKVIVNRSYVKDHNNDVIAGVAQVKFPIQSLDVVKKLTEEYTTLNYYKEEYTSLKNQHCGLENMIGSNARFLNKKKEGVKAAKTDFPVLITGETGTGKELFASGIHNTSNRKSYPMVSINCAAIPNELLESELFGYVDGAFTGAKKGGKKGKLEVANRGTIFLDEIGDMPLAMQAKLLRALEEKKIDPIGSTNSIPINTRIIAATRKNLYQMIEDGSFREDLFYRLNVINIEMVPLRERRDDITQLSQHFLNSINNEYRTNIKFSNIVKQYFMHYDWPGNIRELNNVIKSAYAISNGDTINLNDLPARMIHKIEINYKDNQSLTLKEKIEDYEKKMLSELLCKYNWNCQLAAKEAGIHRSALYKKIDKYNLKKPY